MAWSMASSSLSWPLSARAPSGGVGTMPKPRLADLRPMRILAVVAALFSGDERGVGRHVDLGALSRPLAAEHDAGG